MEFNLQIFFMLLLAYGTIRATLFFKKSGNFLYIIVVSIFILIITNNWALMYGGSLKDLYDSYSSIVNIVPLLLFLGYIYLENQKKKISEEKERVRKMFGKYVSDSIIKEVMKKGKIKIGGERKEVTILYTDVRGFTDLSERIPAEEVVKLLNQHFDVLTKVALKHRGTVDKFIGDAVMVVFGAPISQKDHALHAVECGVEMQQKMKELNEKLKNIGEHLYIGVSINSGEAIIGNIGSEKFMDYTAVGDTVNTASRMQSAAGQGEIVISEATYSKVKDRKSVV